MKRLDTRNNHPCLNRSLVNLKGECWKYVPESDENYQLSNYGRLKGLPRYVEFSDGRAKWTKEKILKLSVVPRFNPLVKKYYYDVRGVFNYNGQRFSFGVGRMVYHLFAKPINFAEDAKMICHKDDDDLNNHVSNLLLLNCGDKQRLSFKRKRQTSHLSQLDYSIRLKTLRAKAKPIVQYNRHGKKIASYKSLVEAARKTGCSAGNISSAARGKVPHTGGFIWKYVQKK